MVGYFPIILVLICSHMYTTTATELPVPAGIDVVLSPSTNATWWNTNGEGKQELVSFSNDLTRVDQNGHLLINVRSTTQSGIYSQKFYIKAADLEWTTDKFPELQLFRVNKEELKCTFIQSKVEIMGVTPDAPPDECITEIKYYINSQYSTSTKPGLYNCADAGPPFNVLEKGTEIALVPSTTATWWISHDGIKSIPVKIDKQSSWVDEYGRLRVKIGSADSVGLYKVTFYSESESKEREWNAKPFPLLKLDKDLKPFNGTVIAEEGKKIVLNCSIHHPRHEEKIMWYRYSQLIDTGWTFTVTNVQQVDSGIYVCVKDNIGQAIRLYVKGRSIENKNATAHEGQSFALLCDLKGNGIKWQTSDNATVRGQGGVLNITNVTKAHSGRYLCSTGEAVQMFTVHVLENEESAVTKTSTNIPVGGIIIGVVVALFIGLLIGVAGFSYRRYKRIPKSGYSEVTQNEQENGFAGLRETVNGIQESHEAKPDLMSIDEFAELVRQHYNDVLHKWYKPVLSLTNVVGHWLYISPVLRLEEVDKNVFKSPLLYKTDILTVITEMNPGSRIVIAGDAGHGKSSLVNYLCQLWLDSNENMKRFKIVICGFLKHVTHKQLFDILSCDFGIPFNQSSRNLDIFKKMDAQQILWIFDGFDELQSTFLQSEISDLLKGKLFPESSVILTTRPHCMDKIPVHDRHCFLHIQKFSEKNAQAYVTQCTELATHNIDKTDLKVFVKDVPKELLSVPLFLALICTLHYEANRRITIDEIDTRTKLMHFLLRKSVQEASRRHNPDRNEYIPIFKYNPLESTVDNDIRTNLTKLGRACYFSLEKNKHSIDVAELDKMFLDVKKIGELGIGDLLESSSKDQVTFPHAFIHEYLCGIFLVYSDMFREQLFQSMKENYEKSKLPINKVFGPYWQPLLFAVGMEPSTLTQFSEKIIKKVFYNIKDDETRVMHIPIPNSQQLYNECYSHNAQQKFVSLLAQCELTLRGPGGPYKCEKHFPLLSALKAQGVISTWGETLKLCTRESDKVKLHGAEFRVMGAVLGALLDIADYINVQRVELRCCQVNLGFIKKATSHLSEIDVEECEIYHSNEGTSYKQVTKLKVRRCQGSSLSELSACFPELTTLQIIGMAYMFLEDNENICFPKVTKLVLSHLQHSNEICVLDISNLVQWFPNLVTVSLKKYKLSKTVPISEFKKLQTLSIDVITDIKNLCQSCPYMKTLAVIIGRKEINIPFYYLTHCLTDIKQELHLIVLYAGTPPDYDWLKPCQDTATTVDTQRKPLVKHVKENKETINPHDITENSSVPQSRQTLDKSSELSNAVQKETCTHGMSPHDVVLQDMSRYKPDQAHVKALTHIKRFTTNKPLDDEELGILKAHFPKSKIEYLVKAEFDSLLYTQKLDLRWFLRGKSPKLEESVIYTQD